MPADNLPTMLNDLNMSIADLETFKAQKAKATKEFTDSLSRAIGQLKAARTSIIMAMQMEVAQ